MACSAHFWARAGLVNIPVAAQRRRAARAIQKTMLADPPNSDDVERIGRAALLRLTPGRRVTAQASGHPQSYERVNADMCGFSGSPAFPGSQAPRCPCAHGRGELRIRIGLRRFWLCHTDEAICHDDRSPLGVAHPCQASRRVGRGREPNSDGSGSARASTPAATPEIPPLRPRRRRHSPRCYRARRDRSGRPTGGE